MQTKPKSQKPQLHQKSKIKNQAGFTLIELLVVISIISLISSVLLVAFVNVRKAAATTKKGEDIKTLIQAIKLFREENGYFPPSFTDYPSGIFTAQSNDANWDILGTSLHPYLGTMPKPPDNTTYQVQTIRYNDGSQVSNSSTMIVAPNRYCFNVHEDSLKVQATFNQLVTDTPYAKITPTPLPNTLSYIYYAGKYAWGPWIAGVCNYGPLNTYY